MQVFLNNASVEDRKITPALSKHSKLNRAGIKWKIHILLLMFSKLSLLFALVMTSNFRRRHVYKLKLMKLDCSRPALQPSSSSVECWFQPEHAWALLLHHPPGLQGWGDELLLHKANFHSLGTGAKCPFVWTAGKAVTRPLPALTSFKAHGAEEMEPENAKQCFLSLPICCGNTLPLTCITKQHLHILSSVCTDLIHNKKVLDLLLHIAYLCLAKLLQKHSVLCCQDPVNISEYGWPSHR